MLKLLRPKIVERYPDGPEFDYMKPMEDREGEPFIIRGEGEMMRDEEPGPSNRKRPREPDYEADDEDSDARSHPKVKEPKHHAIVSDEEEEPSEPEDDRDQDPDYNPFVNEEALPQDPRRKREEAARSPKMTKEESIGSNTEEKPPKPVRQPFKNIDEDEWYVEDDWYEPRGPDSLRYHYPEETVQYIIKRRAEKRAKALENEVIDLTGDSD